MLRTFALLTGISALPCAAAVSGEAVYQRRCASCHDGGNETAPPRDALKQLSVARILRTLDFGVMINIAYLLNREEREAVAKYLGVQRPDAPVPPQAYCADRTVNIGASPSPVWNGWGPDPRNTRYTTTSGITLNQVGKLKLKWAYAFEGDVSAFGAPTVLGHNAVRRQRGGRGTGAEHGFRLRSLGVSGQWAGAIRPGCSAQRRDARAGVHRSDRLGLRRGGRERTALMEEETGAARIHAVDGLGCRPQWRGLHSRRLLGRNALKQSRLSVLHVPRQRDGVAREGWKPGVEDLHDS